MATPKGMKLIGKPGGLVEPGIKKYGVWEWITETAVPAAKEYAPLIKTGVAALSTYASYKDQKKKNQMQQDAYNDYMAQVAAAGHEAQPAIDINYTPMTVSGVPTSKADVTDFTAVAAQGGLMSIPNKQRKRYYGGTNPNDIPTIDEMSPPFDPREEGISIGQQVFYDTGRGDRANAAQIWGQMDNPDKAPFDFDFEIFFMDGGWRDMIKSQVDVQEDVQLASDPGMGEGPFMMEEFLQAVKEGFTGSYDDFIGQIDRSPADYMGQAPGATGIMQAAKGGRIGYQEGIGPNQGSPSIMAAATTDSGVEDAYGVSVEGAALLSEIKQIAEQSVSPQDFPATDSDYEALEVLSNKHNVDLEVIIQMAKTTNFPTPEQSKGEMYAQYMARGGRPGYALGTSKEGIMNLGGLEKDYRTTGGFVPIGAYEKKDDVPARLSKNEFVMTADAVRAAGGGSINRGAQRMYDTMKHLEASPGSKRMTA